MERATDNPYTLSHLPIDLDANQLLRLSRSDEIDSLVEYNTRIFDERITLCTSDLI
jgi:hypothetical protein